MEWVPTISDRNGPLYLQIVEAMQADIASGRLNRGQQLPTQRSLAKVLKVDLTTVTRAYTEARRQGLTEARVGQGTFVAESTSQSPRTAGQRPDIDLSMNVPPQPLEADLDGRILRGLAMMQREDGFFAHLNYRPTGGSVDERAIASAWLARRVPEATPDSVLVCAGTQSAILAFLLANTKRGDVVLAESLTFPGFRSAAECAGIRVVGLRMDGEGVIPEALSEACKRHAPKAVYLIPTMQNPTTATMPAKRRAAVARIIHKHDLPVFEDDAYGILAPDVTPLASLAPRQTYWAVSLSKCLAPGLRVSILKAPDRGAAVRFSSALRASVQMAPPLMVALVMRWLRDGSAEDIISAIRNEAAARQRIASQALAGIAYAAHPSGHHIWMPLPSRWDSAALVATIQRRGLGVVAGEAFSVGDSPGGIRVSLGAARSRAELATALEILASVYRTDAGSAHIV